MPTHVPFKPWCEYCVQGSGHGGHNRRKTDPGGGSLETVVQMDCTSHSQKANQHRIEGESALVTVLNLVDGGRVAPEQRLRTLDAVEQYLNTLEHRRVTRKRSQERG